MKILPVCVLYILWLNTNACCIITDWSPLSYSLHNDTARSALWRKAKYCSSSGQTVSCMIQEGVLGPLWSESSNICCWPQVVRYLKTKCYCKTLLQVNAVYCWRILQLLFFCQCQLIFINYQNTARHNFPWKHVCFSC